jgi:hypothetical protein
VSLPDGKRFPLLQFQTQTPPPGAHCTNVVSAICTGFERAQRLPPRPLEDRRVRPPGGCARRPAAGGISPRVPPARRHTLQWSCCSTHSVLVTIFRVPVNVSFVGAGSPGANIWHIRTTGGIGAVETAQGNALIGYIRQFYNSCQAYLPTTNTYTLGTVTDVATGRELSLSWSSLSGLGTGNAPQALAVVVTWKTTIAARRGRGRTFLGPLATTVMQSDGTMVDATRTAILGHANTLISSSLADGNGAVGVYGYDTAKTPGKENPRNPLDGRIFRDVTGAAIRDVFGVLRSRRD